MFFIKKYAEGQEFCKKLRTTKFLPSQNLDDEANYFNWDIFKNYDPTTLLSKQEEQKNMSMDNEDDFLCLVCMLEVPQTIVHPCGCCVVCKRCSRNITEHATKKEMHKDELLIQCECMRCKCISCQRHVESIEELE